MQELIDRALAEDLGTGDVTSIAVVPEGALARARIEQKAPGVIAGLPAAESVFRRVHPALRWHARVVEGEWRDSGLVAEVAGSARAILAGERVALNFLGHLSGVATLTARYVKAIEGTGARILDTRKTTPGMRALEKQAVVAGGGHNHRVGLFDAMLVKENHSALGGGVAQATRSALAGALGDMKVEIECATLAQVDEALEAGAKSILLDNMTLDELRAATARCKGRAETEASGGVNLETVRGIAETGVDWISVGALTHSVPSLDLTLLLDPL